MKAKDIMTSNPDCIVMSEKATKAAQIMKSKSIGSVPVVKSEQR